MTNDEAEKILHGDVSGLEFMRDKVYKVCLALVYIVDSEGCYYNHEDDVKWAEAYITSYEYYKKEGII